MEGKREEKEEGRWNGRKRENKFTLVPGFSRSKELEAKLARVQSSTLMHAARLRAGLSGVCFSGTRGKMSNVAIPGSVDDSVYERSYSHVHVHEYTYMFLCPGVLLLMVLMHVNCPTGSPLTSLSLSPSLFR